MAPRKMMKANRKLSKYDNCCCCGEDADDDLEDVCVLGNEIYFYTDVSEISVMWLNKTIRKLERELITQTSECGANSAPEIKLYINSPGGDMFAGMSALDHVASSKLKITTIADGMCASAATFILLGGHRRMIKQHAHVLIHQLSTNGFWGKFEDLKDEMKSCKKFMDMIRSIYGDKCDIPDKKMESMMKKDIYLDAEECLKFKIVDEVLGGRPVKKTQKKVKKRQRTDDSSDEE